VGWLRTSRSAHQGGRERGQNRLPRLSQALDVQRVVEGDKEAQKTPLVVAADTVF